MLWKVSWDNAEGKDSLKLALFFSKLEETDCYGMSRATEFDIKNSVFPLLWLSGKCVLLLKFEISC